MPKSETFDPRVSYQKTDDTDIRYTGVSYPALGIFTNDKLDSVLDKVATTLSKLTSIEERLASLEERDTLDSGSIKANSLLFDLIDHSDAISHSLEQKKVNVEVKTSNTKGMVDINFDFADALNTLDSKYVPVGIETSVRTYDSANKLLGSSSSRTGSMSINDHVGPVLVTSRVNIKSPDADLVMTKTFYVPTLNAQNLSGNFKVSGVSVQEANNVTQKDYNEIVASNISRLQKDLAALSDKLS